MKRTLALSSAGALMLLALTIGAPSSGAVANTCRARNTTQGTASSADLQRVIKDAHAGDVIAVRYVCVGNFKIAKRLTLIGKSTPELSRPVLHANGSGRVLFASAKVKLENLRITGGKNTDDEDAGGILAVGGVLTLKDTVVNGNEGTYAGGIMAGTWDGSGPVVRLNGSSAVINNVGTGIFVGNQANVTLNGTARIAGNFTGVVTYYGSLTLRDAASVDSNDGVGIHAQFGQTTMGDTSSVADNKGVGIFNRFQGGLTLNGSASVAGNLAGGIWNEGGLFMNDSSSVSEQHVHRVRWWDLQRQLR